MRYDVNTVSAVSNGVNKSMDFKIGDAGVLIDILRNRLYSDKIRVVVQEYLSNSRDAMREAKNTTDRIEVTLPTSKKPVLSIRDYGHGLSPERVGEVFVQFGKSTKRDSETQTGGFGIGGKSAFAYTDSFTVISIFEGVETHYVAHLGKTSVGSLDQVYQGPTKNKSGVEIQIGVNKVKDDNDQTDIDKFNSMVYRTIAFWSKDEMPVIKNSHDAESCNWYSVYSQLEDGGGFKCDSAILLKIPNFYDRTTSLVIDGIPYDLPKDFKCKNWDKLRYSINNGHLYIIIPAGKLEISSSREAIAVNQTNNETLSRLMANALKSMQDKVAKMIGEVNTIIEARQLVKDLGNLDGGVKSIKKTIEGIPVNFTNGTIADTENYRGVDLNGRRRMSASFITAYLNSYFLINDSELADSTLEAKIKAIHKNNSGLVNFTVLSKNLTKQAETLGAVPVSSLRAQREYSNKPTVPDGSVNIRVFKGYGDRTEFEHVEINDTNGVTYVLVQGTETKEDMQKYSALQIVLDKADAAVKIAFPSKATMKSVTGQPNFILESEFLKDVKKHMSASKYKDAVTLLKELVVGDVYTDMRCLYNLKESPHSITDAAFVKFIKTIKDVEPVSHDKWGDFTINTANDTLVKSVFDLGAVSEVPQFVEYVKTNYPMMNYASSYSDVDELVHYINGKYTFMQKQAKAG